MGRKRSDTYRRVDANQRAIREALRAAGATVTSLSAVGHGAPDLLVGWHGKNLLFEVKDGNKAPSARALSDDEKTWHATWKGQVHIVLNEAEAIRLLRES